MRKKIQEMREKRANLIKEARSIIETAENEKRERTAEENTRYDKLMDDFSKLGEEVERLERMLKADDELRASQGRHAGGQGDPEPEKRGQNQSPRATDEYRAAFQRFLVEGPAALSSDEIRAMQADSSIGGGYLIAPEQMVMEIIKFIDNMTFIRKLSRKFTLKTAASMGAPKLDTDVSDADWTVELKTGGQTEVGFGKRELRPHPLAKQALISNTLLRLSAIDIESFVRERLAYIFGITQEKAFLTGDGAGKPLGVFTASPLGISTTRDVSTGNKSTAIQFDGLIEAKYSIKPQYWPGMNWIFHRDGVKQLAKLKDGEGQYIWSNGVQGGEPDKLLSFPVNLSEYTPNTFTTGQYVGILGNFQYYWIADALDMAFQRLVELYATTNQTGYIGRMETDGMPVLEEAFARVKLA